MIVVMSFEVPGVVGDEYDVKGSDENGSDSFECCVIFVKVFS